MSDRSLATLAGGIVLVVVCWAGVLVMTGTSTVCGQVAGTGVSSPSTPDTPPATGWPGVGEWDATQVDNAALIVAVGIRMGVPGRGWVIAVATAMRESGLRNLPNLGARNDHDSLGLFQQRPSQGWGTPTQILDRTYAATRFYQHLLTVPGWQQLPLTVAAQDVQHSAYPDAYTPWEAPATTLVTTLTGHTPPASCTPGVSAQGWVAPVTGPVTRGYRPTARPPRDGVTIAAPTGTPIRAAAAGTVTAVGCDAHVPIGFPVPCDTPGSLTVSGLGWYVTVTHPGGVTTTYGNQHQHPFVTVGDQVTAGEVIGVTGASGHTTGPQLYFQVTLPTGPTDPVVFMAARGAPLTPSR